MLPSGKESFIESIARERQVENRDSCLLYVGTYTDGKSKGIYAFRFSSDHGTLRHAMTRKSGASSGPRLTPIGLVAQTVNPSFLAGHPSSRFLYAVGEVKQYKGQPSGLVSAFSIDSETGALTHLGEVASGGPGPCHVSVDHSGKFAIVANYVGGSVTVFRILDNGGLGDITAFVQHSDPDGDPTRVRRPRAHGAFLSPDNRFVVVPDLGLDKLFVYRLDPNSGGLEPTNPPSISLPAGAGPRHFVFHPSGNHGYVINERDSTIITFCCDRVEGTLQPFQVSSTLPPNFCGDNSTAEIEVDGEGRFLYVSNRGADNIAVFSIGPQACLQLVEHVPAEGRTPRHFAIAPSGAYLIVANQHSDNIVVFRRDRLSGRLAPSGQQHEVGAPACLVFVPRR